MKKIIFPAVLLLIIFNTAKAQTPAFTDVWNQQVDMNDDSLPTLPLHYKEMVEKFYAQPVSAGHIIFLGNSITEMGHWKELLHDSTVMNRGIGGDVTYGLLKRLGDIIRQQPSKLFILIGINDLGKNVPDDTIYVHYRLLLQRLKKALPQTRIYVESILPVNPDMKNFPAAYNKNEEVKKVNEQLKAIVKANHCTWINIYDQFMDKNGHLIKQYSREGLHLNPAGYEHWIAYLKARHYL